MKRRRKKSRWKNHINSHIKLKNSTDDIISLCSLFHRFCYMRNFKIVVFLLSLKNFLPVINMLLKKLYAANELQKFQVSNNSRECKSFIILNRQSSCNLKVFVILSRSLQPTLATTLVFAFRFTVLKFFVLVEKKEKLAKCSSCCVSTFEIINCA